MIRVLIIAALAAYIALGETWPDSEAWVAEKCRVSRGQYAVLIDSRKHICWPVGGLDTSRFGEQQSWQKN